MTVRRATPLDRSTVIALRLRSMRDAPDAFGSTLERELQRTDEDWSRWIAPGATFIAENPDDLPVGLVLAMHGDDDPDVVNLMAMWVEPEERGTGIADALVAAVLTWGIEQGARAVRLLVDPSNVRARHLYARHGFVDTNEVLSGPDRVVIEMQHRGMTPTT